jgi:hypothetical protein
MKEKQTRRKAPVKEVSRQRRWQLRKQAEGKCIICGQPVATSLFCLKHAIVRREQSRIRFGRQRRLRSLTYRLEEAAQTQKKKSQGRKASQRGKSTRTAMATAGAGRR